MRIAIVGAGAIGCFLAAKLSEHGHTVTLIGRQNQADALTAHGLLLRDSSGSERRYTIPAVTHLTEHPDLVLLTVKTQDVTQACEEIRAVAPDVPVVAMQNGLQADRLAGEVLGRETVLGAIVMCAVSYLKPGEIEVQFTGWIVVGEPFRASGTRLREVVGVLSAALPTYATSHMQRTRWTKLISNLNNGICAATGLAVPELAQTRVGRELSIRVMKEGYRVARAAGIRLDHGLYGLSPHAFRQDPNATLIALAQSAITTLLAIAPEPAALAVLGVAGRSRLNQLPIRFSTWQSIARGKPSEIEYLNGEIVRLGRQLGVATPYNGRVVEMVHRVEQTHTFCAVEELLPPSTPEEAAYALEHTT